MNSAVASLNVEHRRKVASVVLEAVLDAKREARLERFRIDRETLLLGLQARFGAGFDLIYVHANKTPELVLQRLEQFIAWLLGQLRPDGAHFNEPVARHLWLHHVAWRPFVALVCHYRFLDVVLFADHPHGALASQTPAEQLTSQWDIASSSFYRYVERGRHLLVDVLLDWPPATKTLVHHYEFVQAQAIDSLALTDNEQRNQWHTSQADKASQLQWPRAQLWHCVHANDIEASVTCLETYASELAADPCTDRMIARLMQQYCDAQHQVPLLLAHGLLERVRGLEVQEQRLYIQALKQASALNDAKLLGQVYGALGRYYESRDIDRAFSYLRQSTTYFEQYKGGVPANVALDSMYGAILVRLGWLYVVRNDPRAQPLLTRAQNLLNDINTVDDTKAMLFQAWGEFWRRDTKLTQALEATHQALQIYEKSGNQLQQLKTYGNLALIYGDMREFAQAADYSKRVIELARSTPVDPDTIAATYLNLGAAYFWQENYAEAIVHYKQALQISERAQLGAVTGRAHYNLAEAFYQLFQLQGNKEHENQGDHHTALSQNVWEISKDSGAIEATRNLKRTVLGQRENLVYDRLLPAELAAHFDEMTQIQAQRHRLAVPQSLQDQVQAHLHIAQAYLDIAVKEREAAVQLINDNLLSAQFESELNALQARFNRSQSTEELLAAQWAGAAPDLINSVKARKVIEHVRFNHSINKSCFAQLCDVSPATASKRLSELVNRSLLVKQGNGPQTRYLLA
jgi:tetratricopeptide (TPR) repeat protein